VAELSASGVPNVLDNRKDSVPLVTESGVGLPEKFVDAQKKSMFAPAWPKSNPGPAPGMGGAPAAMPFATPAPPGANLQGSNGAGSQPGAAAANSREAMWEAKRKKFLQQQGIAAPPPPAQQHAPPAFMAPQPPQQQMQMHSNAPKAPMQMHSNPPMQQQPRPPAHNPPMPGQNAAPPAHHMQQHQHHPQQEQMHMQQTQSLNSTGHTQQHNASGEIDMPDPSGGVNQIGASGHNRQKQIKRQLQQDYQKFVGGQQVKKDMVTRVEGVPHMNLAAGGGPHQQQAPPSGRRSIPDAPEQQEGLGLGIGREGQSQSEHFRKQERAEMQKYLQKEAAKSARRGQPRAEESGLDLGKTRQLQKDKLREEQQRDMQNFMRDQKRGSRRGDPDNRLGSAEQGLGLGQEHNQRQKMIREQQKKDLENYMQTDQYQTKQERNRDRERDRYDSSGPPPFPQEPINGGPAPDQHQHQQQQHQQHGQQGAYPASPHAKSVAFSQPHRAVKPHMRIEPPATVGGAALDGFGLEEAVRQKKRADMQEEMRQGLARQVEESKRKKEAEEREKKMEEAREMDRIARERQRSEDKVVEYERNKKGGSHGSAGMGPSHSHGPPPPAPAAYNQNHRSEHNPMHSSQDSVVLPPRHPGPPSIIQSQGHDLRGGNGYPQAPPPAVAAQVQRPPPPQHFDAPPVPQAGIPPPNPMLQAAAMAQGGAPGGGTARDEKLFSALMEQQKSLYDQNQTQVQSLRQDLESLRKDRDEAQKAFLDMKEQHLKEKEQELDQMKEQVIRQQFYSSSNTPIPGALSSSASNINLENTFSTIAEEVKQAARFVPKYSGDDVPLPAQTNKTEMPLPITNNAKTPSPLPPVRQPANYNDSPKNSNNNNNNGYPVGIEPTPPDAFEQTLPSNSKLVSVVDMTKNRAWTGRTYKAGNHLGDQMSARNLPIYETSGGRLEPDASRAATPQEEKEQPPPILKLSRKIRQEKQLSSKPSSAEKQERREELKEASVQKEPSKDREARRQDRESRQEISSLAHGIAVADAAAAPESRELPPLKMPNNELAKNPSRRKLPRHEKKRSEQREKSFGGDRQDGFDEAAKRYDDKRFADFEKRFNDPATANDEKGNGSVAAPLKNIDLSRKINHGASEGFLQSAVAALREFRGPQKERSYDRSLRDRQNSTTSLQQSNAGEGNNAAIEDDRQSTADSIDLLLIHSGRKGYEKRSPMHQPLADVNPRRHKFHGSLPSPSPGAVKSDWNDTGDSRHGSRLNLRASAPVVLPSTSNSPEKSNVPRRSRKNDSRAQHDSQKLAVMHGLREVSTSSNRDLPPLQPVSRSPMNRSGLQNHLTVNVQPDDDAKSFGTSVEFNAAGGAQTPTDRGWVPDPDPLPNFNDRELAPPGTGNKTREFSEGFRKSFDKEKSTRASVDKETRESLKMAIRAVKEEHKSISTSAPGAPPSLQLQPPAPPTHRSDSSTYFTFLSRPHHFVI